MFYRTLELAAIHGGCPESAIAVIDVHTSTSCNYSTLSFCDRNMICNVGHEERRSSCRSVLVGGRLGCSGILDYLE